jgi:DNA-binding XRE family transcriptional regulator
MLTSELTAGERLYIYRRRCEYTQAEMAEEHGISCKTYRDWETGVKSPPKDVKSPIGNLKNHEVATTLRRRKGINQPDLAEEIGVCTWWLCQMETGRAPMSDALIEYWGL